jgi:succinate-semialdehyde dehydrogenase / glutarate-semialdehyde dehydrogenase
MAEITPMIIDGKTVAPAGSRTIDVINPSTEEVVGRVGAATADDVDRAARSSYAAFKTWRETPAADRAAAMAKVVAAVRGRADELATLITKEQGKPLPQAKGEIGGFCGLLEYYAQEARRISGSVLQSDQKDRFVYVLKSPIGVVAAIPPWNDPLNLLARMMGPALAAGCTVVAKPSSQTPLATLLMGKIAAEAGLPPGVLNVISGPGGETGEALVRHPLVRKASLTGSVEGGQAVMRAAAEGIKRVTLELGGQCPCIVWDDADLEKAADALTFQAFRSCGQVCNRVNRVYVHRKVYKQLSEQVAQLAGRIKVGDGFADGVDIGPLNNKRQLDWVMAQIKDAVGKGARVLTGGKRIGTKGFFHEPTVLVDCTHKMDVMVKETFGPVLAFAVADDNIEKAIDQANDTVYGLSAYFFSADARNCFLAGQRLEAGSIWINDIHGSMLQAPYGGMKLSGMGREQGGVAVDEYLEIKTIYQEMSKESRGARLCVRR